MKVPPQIISLASTLALATADHQRLSPSKFADELFSPSSSANELVSICTVKSDSIVDAHSKISLVEQQQVAKQA